MPENQRVCFRLPTAVLGRLDGLVERGEYLDRPTALFHATRLLLEKHGA